VKPSDDNYKKIHGYLEGVHVITPDWNSVLQDLSKDVARWREVTGS
jgi:2-aminoethylphosphonate transport system substrate-binding protein